MSTLSEVLLKLLGGTSAVNTTTVIVEGSPSSYLGRHREPEKPEQYSAVEKQKIEIQKVRMYVNVGTQRVYTENIYKNRSRGFGVEMRAANNTKKLQNIGIGCCVYDSDGNTRFKKNTKLEIEPKYLKTYRLYINENEVRKLERGKYKVQLWAGNKKIKRIDFNIL